MLEPFFPDKVDNNAGWPEGCHEEDDPKGVI